jgi:Heterokaryon incompatibility protein (HET).
MRLLHIETLQVEDFIGSVLKYAILSHTCGKEVPFADVTCSLKQARKKAGFATVKSTCKLAKEQGYDYIWIDAACIDKSSSAELLEAIIQCIAGTLNQASATLIS